MAAGNESIRINHSSISPLEHNLRIYKLKSLALTMGITFGFTLFSWFAGGFAGIIIMLSAVIFIILSSLLHGQMDPQTRLAVYIPLKAAPGLYHDLKVLAHRANLIRIPQLYLLPDNYEMAAFTTSKNGVDMIFFSRGLLEGMHRNEIRGVMAHEVAHIASGDLMLMGSMRLLVSIFNTAAGIFQGAILIILLLTAAGLINLSFLFVLLMFFGPSASVLALLALSRLREYHADAVGATLTKDPVSLARALRRISMQDFNPLRIFGFFSYRRRNTVPEHLRTHPDTEKRIQKLLEYVGFSS